MNGNWELLPFGDPQQRRTRVRFCPVCGREIYGSRGQCSYCARFFP